MGSSPVPWRRRESVGGAAHRTRLEVDGLPVSASELPGHDRGHQHEVDERGRPDPDETEAHGQAIPAWDPRPLKATGVTYCTSAMGADHTAGLIVNPGLQPDEFAQASQECQIVNAACDSSGFCQFLQVSINDMADFYSAFYGEEVTREQVADIGWECMQDEWKFNTAAGWTPEDDTMADCLIEEGIGPDNVFKFDVDEGKTGPTMEWGFLADLVHAAFEPTQVW